MILSGYGLLYLYNAARVNASGSYILLRLGTGNFLPAAVLLIAAIVEALRTKKQQDSRKSGKSAS